MSGYPTPRLRICNNPKCLTEFVSASRQAFYCPDCQRDRRNAAKRERERRQIQENPEKFREKRRAYKASHPEEVRQSDKRYYEKHKEEKKARSTQWVKENPEAHREHARRWKARHAELAAQDVTRVTKNKNPTRISGRPEIVAQMSEIQTNLKAWEAAGEMHYCERMRLRCKNLPCGQRGECYAGKKCHLAPERPPRKIINLFA